MCSLCLCTVGQNNVVCMCVCAVYVCVLWVRIMLCVCVYVQSTCVHCGSEWCSAYVHVHICLGAASGWCAACTLVTLCVHMCVNLKCLYMWMMCMVDFT